MSGNIADSSGNDDDAKKWRDVFQGCEAGLRAFLRGRLGQEADIEDCLQVVWLKMIENNTNVAEGARRAWLFRVASNESARIWRRRSTTQRVLEKQSRHLDETVADEAIDKVILAETANKLQQAIEQLPESTQQIIQLRIHENLTFQEVANELKIPLGTALTRMRRAMDQLKKTIEPDE